MLPLRDAPGRGVVRGGRPRAPGVRTGGPRMMRRTLEPVLLGRDLPRSLPSRSATGRRVEPDSPSSRPECGCVALACRARLRVPRRPRALAAFMARDAEPRDPAPRASGPERAARRARRRVRRPVDRDRLPARRRSGSMRTAARSAAARGVGPVADRGERRRPPVAAIVHDAGLRNDDAFVATATSYALMTLDNQRLSAQARGTAARGPRVAGADPGDGRRGAPPDRARPPRRRPAAPRRAAHRARARGRGGRGARRRARRDAARARHRRGGGHRRGPLARARHLPGGARRSRAGRRAARGRFALRPADDRARRRARRYPRGSRPPPTSAASRRCRTSPSTPTARRDRRRASPTTATCASRSATTGPGFDT